MDIRGKLTINDAVLEPKN